jgi:putative intracellular protease/amidase
MIFKPEETLQTARELDTIIIPGRRGLRQTEVSEKISDWILARANRTRRIAAICNGIYGLASTGLLDGREVTTHWRKQPAPVTAVAESSFWQRMLWGTKITAGVVNAFDRNPPTVLGAFNDNYDTSLYTIRNRFWYVALSKKF